MQGWKIALARRPGLAF